MNVLANNCLAPDWHPLNWIDEYLKARGWTHNGTGWIPPETFREALEISRGRGCWARSTAIAAQVKYEEFEAAQHCVEPTAPARKFNRQKTSRQSSRKVRGG